MKLNKVLTIAALLFAESSAIIVNFNDIADEADLETNDEINAETGKTQELLFKYEPMMGLAQKSIELGDIGRAHAEDGIKAMKVVAQEIKVNIIKESADLQTLIAKDDEHGNNVSKSHEPQLSLIQKESARLMSKFAPMEGLEKELSLIHGEKDTELAEIRESVHSSVLEAENLYNKRSAAQSEKQGREKEMEDERKFQLSL